MKRDGNLYAFLRRTRNSAIHKARGWRDVHRTAFIHHSVVASHDLKAAEFVFVGPGSRIDPGVSIGRYTMLASHVAIIGDDHVTDLPGVPIQFSGRPPQQTTTIGDDVWIGYRAIVRRGLTIGRGSIVAANAVVTSDVAPYTIVAGVPARAIGERFLDSAERQSHDRMLDGPLQKPQFTERLSASAGAS